MRVARMGCRLVLRALTALALVVAPFHLSVEGFVVAKAYAGKGGGNGNGGGNSGGGNGNGNSGGNNGNGNSGNGNSGGNSSGSGNSNSGGNSGNSNSGGNSGNSNSGGNSGNSNSGGNSGNSNSGGTNGNSKGAANGASNASTGTADVDDHVNALTGDKVEVSNNSIQVTHRNGMKETIENGRFRMEDKFGRTIVERRATMADLNRLKSL
ncbi:hypothetical protein [Mesorhizobium sp. M1B.F.Ca.ET.045.04.1.1]|uniref:hypothetical protein n=1 Tax=Mesorhizobium sp. M1B.F.Ca.ET.045.04.1.1 TaxID=2493673 RepID=UPI000F764F83|nr:hypothetical protein [Mesorhizobium sp. M1B.F.Ca.ET.045.04.1.1]AZO31082.1 hypothetical protein EJ071_29285 [Mesorhizobium sp. M1B.F.Ca.ET.045.04.1.1]